ncbi:hypothetical protein AB0A05_27085 [Streptomyces sp. NPDC046374]|uniref:hypothetical protein n=1 Tax=Streptomyces sp. NPDC046374 TaxID=3154917 RepID=UPI0033D50C95
MSPDAILRDGPARGRIIAFDLSAAGEPPTFLEVQHMPEWEPIGPEGVFAHLEKEPSEDPRRPCLEIPVPVTLMYIRGMFAQTGEPAIDSFGRWIYLHRGQAAHPH